MRDAHWEITIYCLVSFLPVFLLELAAFRKSLRFSVRVTVFLTVLLANLQIGLCHTASHVANQRFYMIYGTILSWMFFLVMVRDHLGKMLFMLLMIANDANLVVAASEYLHFLVGPTPQGEIFDWTHSVMILLTELVILTPIFLFVVKVYARSDDDRRRMKAWNYLWVIPATFYGIWCVLFRFGTETLADAASAQQYFLVTLMIFICSVAVYAIVHSLIQEHVQNEQLREREHLYAIQRTQYASLQERIEEARRAKHDLRHHLHLALVYLNDGMAEQLREYLQGISDAIPDDARLSFCDHYAANALLMYFASQAKQAGVDYSISVDLPTEVGIPDEALVVVLGNLLENAIAACREEPGPAQLRVYGRMDDSAVFFKVRNTCTQTLRRSPTGKLLSTKAQGQGIGLSSVQRIAQQYDGLMETTHEEGQFTVSVMLNFPDA